MVVLSASVLGLILLTVAVQKPTGSESHASGGCASVPKLNYTGSKSGDNSVTYSFNLNNNNPTSCKHAILYAFNISKPGGKWSVEYKKDNGDWTGLNVGITGSLISGDSTVIKARVYPPSGAVNKTYSLKANVCEAYLNDGQIMTGPNSICVTKSLTYVKN